MTTLSLWISHGPRTVLQQGYLERVRELRYRSIAVMVDTMAPGWDPQWTDAQVHWLSARCLQLDLELVITCWPDWDIIRISRMIVDLDRWLPWGAVSVEVDVEGVAYDRGGPGGRRQLRPDYSTVAAYLVERLLRLAERRRVRIELTTHTGHVEITKRARITPHVHRLALQLYSVEHSGPEGHAVHYPWAHPSRGPGRAQDRGIRLARRVPEVASGRVRLTAGLPAWAQRWPGHELREAVSTALEAALRWNPVEVRYWDSRAVLGVEWEPGREPAIAEVIRSEWERLAPAS